jgi:hypothetical protein
MNRSQVVVIAVTFYALIFQASPWLGFSDAIIFTMFILSPFVMIYMVYMVLRFGEPSKNTFEERFYDDLDYKRNGREDMEPGA